MSENQPEYRPFPRGALTAAAFVVTLTIVFAAVGRIADVGTTRMPVTAEVDVRMLRFEDRADGGINVYIAGETEPTTEVAPGGDGFVRGLLRGFARDRKRGGIPAEPPYRLVRWADGRLTVSDPTTGRSADVGAFGPDNFGAFKRLFDATADAARPLASAAPAVALDQVDSR